MSHFYGICDDTESIATIYHALDRSLNFPDKADLYGPFTDELLIGQAMAERRKDVFIATMFGMTRDPANPAARASNDRSDYDKAATPASSAGVSNKSICTTCTVLTRPCRLKKPLAPWSNWTSLARCIRLPHCRLNIRCGRVIPESPARSPPAAKRRGLCCLFTAGPWFSHGCLHQTRSPVGRRLSPALATPYRKNFQQSEAGRKGPSVGYIQRRNRVPRRP